ncbi:ATP-binding protein [Mycolicibacterium porcinum]|uniref:ATP-binding protein n=1 Tax=Mycolicibacterium porcinum TaxID=39693 RepID=UPI000849171A|nr:adenylate/guanylate cyclase domain-containing protein [Mycolicibacterium porcinum]ODR17110.1 cyclase [Mycolicibacterium porcinum]
MTADATCGACRTGLRENAKFCDECGAPVHSAAEYKQVTVLFADLVRSMELAAALDPERWRQIVTDLVERSTAVVRRYGGGTVEFTGDGLMAVFGAPAALEDHAFRACLAALAIQDEATRLADEVARRDGVTLRLRVGLNSGLVIAGDIGSAALGYTTTGESVGFAKRMESVAPPGGVMVSESTAHLVEHAAVLGPPELVRIKGGAAPVPARRLLGVSPGHGTVTRREASLVGRHREMALLDSALNRAIDGDGSALTVVGPPGIGKSRVAREAAGLASRRGVQVFWTFCESHARDVPFHAVARLLRERIGVVDLQDDAARRAQLRQQLPGADGQDLLLLADLLGFADPDVALPQIDAETRRRRLTDMLNAAARARVEPALYIIEDAHWIDPVSELMLSDLLAVIPHTPSLMLTTTRPEYSGTLADASAVRSVKLAPLDDSETTALIGELVGSDPSVGELSTIIAGRAAGNPFFAEEMVRELVQRGALTGEPGDYACRVDVAEVSVPVTVQAAIEARIDRLSLAGKRSVYAASVIGARFGAELMAELRLGAAVDDLVAAELIDQVRPSPNAAYAFRHPLIHAVAYESQLKSDRAELHRQVAAAIESRDPAAADQNAALIAEHLQAAGELRSAYGWHMRAAGWAANRDIDAARVSWERALRVADHLPDDDPDQLSMRIAPRTVLCATDFQARAAHEARGRFDELGELCDAAGDKVSLAIGMTGLATELAYSGRSREGAQLVTEQMELLESIGDPNLTMPLAVIAFVNWGDVGRFDQVLRWSQTVIDLAAGDPTKGAGYGVGSPLAHALACRSVARWWLGRPGWRRDFDDALAMAENRDPTTVGFVVAWTYGEAIPFGVLRVDDCAVRVGEEAVQTAQMAGNVHALGLAQLALGGILLHRDSVADRDRGLELIAQARDLTLEHAPLMVPVAELFTARERAGRGDRDAAIPVLRDVVNQLHEGGRVAYEAWGSSLLVEMLLDAASEDDMDEARRLLERISDLVSSLDSVILDVILLRLRALLAQSHGDDVAFRDLAARYRTMAEDLGFEGHIDWSEAMIRTAG